MLKNVQNQRFKEEEKDEEYDALYAETNLSSSSDTNKKVFKEETCEEEVITQESSEEPGSVNGSEILGMIDTYDRPGETSAAGVYSKSETYVEKGFEDKPGKRIPKAGAFAEAGYGRACAKYSIFEAEAKGPSASARAEASLTGVSAMARAELAGASAKAGPVALKFGVGVDTGVSVGVDGMEVKFLGTGFTVGPKNSVSVLGSEVSCAVM